MAKGPGPRQVFPSNIIGIQFNILGGLVFFRVNQHWVGKSAGPAPVAQVSGLPRAFNEKDRDWDTFNMFTASEQTAPQSKPGGTPPGISDPVTNEMLQWYRWWPHDRVVSTTITKTTPGDEVWVIDKASFQLVYDHHITSRLAGGVSRDEAIAEFKHLIDTSALGYEGLDSSLVGVIIEQVYLGGGMFGDPPFPPSPEGVAFWAAAGRDAGWMGHFETGPSSSVTVQDHTTTWLLNIAKLFASVPLDPKTKKKPASYTFRIDAPAFDTSTGGVGSWTIEASAFSTRKSTPPKSTDGRRTFPVGDKPGTSGETTSHLYPTWTPYPDSHGGNINTHAGSYVDVKVTFGVGKVDPKVEIIDHTSGGIVVG